ncbi:MAG: TrkA family potassium uptake protein [Firmicutes bacterium]|nr:TrkA family potassium uptake protein [Bacillota bacterium]
MAPRFFVVIGLGRFGTAVARTLVAEGQTVLALDQDMARVQELSHVLPRVARCDATDIEALRVLGVPGADTAVVAVGDSVEASVLATVNLKELGVRRVVAKATSKAHGKALARCGADRVVYPQRDMGIRVAHNLVSANVQDYVRLSDSHSMVEMVATPGMVGRSLVELALGRRYGVNVVAIRRGQRVIVSPRAEEVVQEGDVLVLIGSDEGIREMEEAS